MENSLNVRGADFSAPTTSKNKREAVLLLLAEYAFVASLVATAATELLPMLEFPELLYFVRNFIRTAQPYALGALVVSVVFLAFALWRDMRTPPPSYKVFNELDEVFDGLGMTANRTYSVLNRGNKAKVIRIWIRINDPKMTTKYMKQVFESGAQLLNNAQLLKIDEHVDKKGLRNGFDLTVFYRPVDDIYEFAEKEVGL